MAQMDWRKYPEELPPADDLYLAVVEYTSNGHTNRVVDTLTYAHNLSDAAPRDFAGANRPGWYDTSVDFYNEAFNYFEITEVIYWMPYPEPPKD